MQVSPGTLTMAGRAARGRPVPVHDAAPAPGFRLTTAGMSVLRQADRPSNVRLTAAAVVVVRKRNPS